MPFRLWELGVGAVLAGISVYQPSRKFRIWLQVFSICAFLAIVIADFSPADFPGIIVLLPVLGTSAVIVAGSQYILGCRPLCAIGNLSYSLYLWHWPFTVFFTHLFPGIEYSSLIGVGFSIIPALLSYRFVETLCRDFPTEGRGRIVKLCVFSCMLPLFLSGFVYWGQSEAWWVPRLVKISETRQGAFNGELSNCHNMSGRQDFGCRLGGEDAQVKLFLVGDSHAAALSEMFAEIAREERYELNIRTAGGCAFVEINMTRCGAYLTETLRRIKATNPDIVVIANNALNANIYGVQAWINGLEVALGRIEGVTDANILVINTVPGTFREDIMTCSRIFLQKPDCGILAKEIARAERKDVVEMEKKTNWCKSQSMVL